MVRIEDLDKLGAEQVRLVKIGIDTRFHGIEFARF